MKNLPQQEIIKGAIRQNKMDYPRRTIRHKSSYYFLWQLYQNYDMVQWCCLKIPVLIGFAGLACFCSSVCANRDEENK
jgi:hypothetical protein